MGSSVTEMFFGEYRHQLDEKCRLRIPAKLKEQLGAHPFIMKGPNKCLLVLKQDKANEFLDRQFGNVDMLDPKNNLSLRSITSSAFYAEEDKQGRILIPNKLLEHAGFKVKGGEIASRSVVTIGVMNRVEIWCEEVWDEYSDVDPDEFDNRLTETLEAMRKSARSE